MKLPDGEQKRDDELSASLSMMFSADVPLYITVLPAIDSPTIIGT